MELVALNAPHFATCTPKSWVEIPTTIQATKQATK